MDCLHLLSVSHLSVLGGGGPWGGDPWGGIRDAWRHRVEALHGGAVVLHDVVGALQGACLMEGAQSGVQIQEPVPVLEPGQRLQQRRRQRRLAAPSAALPSSRRI